MANVTFTSPIMKKDVTVYAVAGDRRNILYLAKKHKMKFLTGDRQFADMENVEFVK